MIEIVSLFLGLISGVHDVEVTTSGPVAAVELLLDGRTVDVDSRPSDAIALASQTKAPIFVEEEVLASASKGYE